MLNNDQLKEALLHDLEELHQAREQLLFEVQIDHIDVRVHWDRIDDSLNFARAEINRLGDHSEEAAREIEIASRRHLDDAKAHVAQLRSVCQSRGGNPSHARSK